MRSRKTPAPMGSGGMLPPVDPHHAHQHSSSSGVKEHHVRTAVLIAGPLLILASILVFTSSETIRTANLTEALFEEAEEVDEAIAEGFSFSLGSEVTDDRDFAQFAIQAPRGEIEQQFYDALNTSPAFDWVDDIYELLAYDDFDANGNIKEEAMLEIIAIASNNPGQGDSNE